MSSQKDYVLNLQKLMDELLLAKKWLVRSYEQCLPIGLKTHYTDEELDHFENLASRFGRACDLLTVKIYRNMDMVELVSGGTFIDVLNRAHKRGLIDSLDQIRTLKDLRNKIVNEYLPTAVVVTFGEILKQTPALFELIDRAKVYIDLMDA